MQESETQAGEENWSWLDKFFEESHTIWTVDEAMALLAGLKPGTERDKDALDWADVAPTERMRRRVAKVAASFTPEAVRLVNRRQTYKAIADRWARDPIDRTNTHHDRDQFIEWARERSIDIPWHHYAISKGNLSGNPKRARKSRKVSEARILMVRKLLVHAGLKLNDKNEIIHGQIEELKEFFDKGIDRSFQVDKGTISTFCEDHGLVSEKAARKKLIPK